MNDEEFLQIAKGVREERFWRTEADWNRIRDCFPKSLTEDEISEVYSTFYDRQWLSRYWGAYVRWGSAEQRGLFQFDLFEFLSRRSPADHSMTRKEMDALPVGALVLNRQSTWFVVIANGPGSDLVVVRRDDPSSLSWPEVRFIKPPEGEPAGIDLKRIA